MSTRAIRVRVWTSTGVDSTSLTPAPDMTLATAGITGLDGEVIAGSATRSSSFACADIATGDILPGLTAVEIALLQPASTIVVSAY